MFLLLLSALACYGYAAAVFPIRDSMMDDSVFDHFSFNSASSNTRCRGSSCTIDVSRTHFPRHFRFPNRDYSKLTLDPSVSLHSQLPFIDYSGISLDDSLSAQSHLLPYPSGLSADPYLSLGTHFPFDFSGMIDNSLSLQSHPPIHYPSGLSLDASLSMGNSAISDVSSKQIHWVDKVGPSLPPILKYYYKPGVANGIKTFVPGQDYKIYYYEDGDLSKKHTYYAGDDYDINLFREGDVYKKMTVKSGDDIDIDAFQAGDKYYDKDVYVEGTKTVKTGKGEPKYYKEKPVTIKGTGLHTGLEMPAEKEMKVKGHLITDSNTNPFPVSFSNGPSASLGFRHGFH